MSDLENQAAPTSSMANQVALRFRRVSIDNIYFRKYLGNDFKSSKHPLPENVKLARNTAIIIGFIEMVFCLLSFGFYILRRSRRSLAFILLTIAATLAGFNAKLKLKYCGLLVHALYTISIIGGFYIYVMLEYFFTNTQNKKILNEDDKRIKNDTLVIFLCSCPLLGLFIMGLHSAYLFIKIDEEYQQREKDQMNLAALQNAIQIQNPESDIVAGNQVSPKNQSENDVKPNKQTPLSEEELIHEILVINDQQLERDECVICLKNKKDSVFYPCGHQCLCSGCADRFKQEAVHQLCPICRNRATDIIRVYK